MPSFRRFPGVNLPGDATPVKGWRNGGDSCVIGTAIGPDAGAPEFEAGGLESEGISGGA